MFGMLDWLSMSESYEQRKVDRYDKGGLIIDTAGVTDGARPYETAVCHPEYNDGLWVIVEAYPTKPEAQKGHNRWVKPMTSKKPPSSLKDCKNAAIAELCGDLEFPRVKKEKSKKGEVK